jgi:DNA polymerase III sliding clamp (beta) subunit (PCNA family)
MTIIFQLKTSDAFVLKILTELLQANLKEFCLVCKSSGIFVKTIDNKQRRGTKLFNIELYRDRFKTYKVPADDLIIGLNLSYFFKVLKSIRKKDSLELYIDDSDMYKLYIKIYRSSDSNPITKHITITKLQFEDFKCPDDNLYTDSIIASCKEFQLLKNLNKINDVLDVTLEDGIIKFHADKETIMSTTVPFGELRNDGDHEMFQQTFNTNDILELIKVAGLSDNVYMYYTNGSPLKIKFDVGTLGNLTVYIKSREQGEEEQNEQATN